MLPHLELQNAQRGFVGARGRVKKKIREKIEMKTDESSTSFHLKLKSLLRVSTLNNAPTAYPLFSKIFV
jgi:hypothetical protein